MKPKLDLDDGMLVVGGAATLAGVAHYLGLWASVTSIGLGLLVLWRLRTR